MHEFNKNENEKIKNEKINVIIASGGLQEVEFLKLTPEQVKLLNWLESNGYLYDYHIETDIQFESI